MKSLSSFKTSEIKTLFKTARTLIATPGITLKGAPKQLEYGRILIVTPKKMGNAPERNLMRRRLKSIFYEQQLYKGSYDIIVFVTHNALAIPFNSLQELVLTAFHEDCS
jgi:ribonuclease P protein component